MASKYERVALRIAKHLDPSGSIHAGFEWEAVATILSEEFAGHEEMKEAIHANVDNYAMMIVNGCEIRGGGLLGKLCASVNRCHDNGDGTITITPRQ